MGGVEAKLLEYLQQQLSQGRLSLSEEELREGVLLENPAFRKRAAFRYGLERLLVRHVINAVDAKDGSRHYFIGSYPSPELRESLGLAGPTETSN